MIDSNIFDQCETFTNCTVQVLTNSVTGEQSVGWWQTPPLDVSRCKYCGGKLSEWRDHNGRKYRHCFSCHFDFYKGDKK